MQARMEKLEHSRVKLTVDIAADVVEKAIEEAYRKNAKKISIPGFRKGKAPKNLVIKTYGIGVLFDVAIKETYPDAYEAVIAAEGFEPVDYPEIEIEDIDEQGKFNFIVRIT